MKSRLLVYTVHKAASMFLHQLMLDISLEINVEHYSVNTPENRNAINGLGWKNFIETHPDAGYFGPIRSNPDASIFPEKLESYSIILHLRDPRDVLVSLFFSYAYSHKKGSSFNPQDAQRKKWQDDGIDVFVLQYLENFKQRYLFVLEKLLPHENVTVLKYEDMVLNYEQWLSAFLERVFDEDKFLEKADKSPLTKVDIPEQLHTRLFNKYKDDFSNAGSTENIYRHKRQILPGDHIRKLKTETIEQLNNELQGILMQLEYEI